jgi:hypothetical protein
MDKSYYVDKFKIEKITVMGQGSSRSDSGLASLLEALRALLFLAPPRRDIRNFCQRQSQVKSKESCFLSLGFERFDLIRTTLFTA